MAEEDTSEDRRIELVAAIILGVAGILTAFAAYNAALTDGDALKGYTASARTTADANGYFNEAFATYTSDQSLFLEYQVLVEQGDTATALVIRDRLFSPELEAATAAWIEIPVGSPDEPPTPLQTAEYVIPAQDEAIALDRAGGRRVQRGPGLRRRGRQVRAGRGVPGRVAVPRRYRLALQGPLGCRSPSSPWPWWSWCPASSPSSRARPARRSDGPRPGADRWTMRRRERACVSMPVRGAWVPTPVLFGGRDTRRGPVMDLTDIGPGRCEWRHPRHPGDGGSGADGGATCCHWSKVSSARRELPAK